MQIKGEWKPCQVSIGFTPGTQISLSTQNEIFFFVQITFQCINASVDKILILFSANPLFNVYFSTSLIATANKTFPFKTIMEISLVILLVAVSRKEEQLQEMQLNGVRCGGKRLVSSCRSSPIFPSTVSPRHFVLVPR